MTFYDESSARFISSTKYIKRGLLIAFCARNEQHNRSSRPFYRPTSVWRRTAAVPWLLRTTGTARVHEGEGMGSSYMVVAGDCKNLWLNIKNELKRVSVDKVRKYIDTSPEPSTDLGKTFSDDLAHAERSDIDCVFDCLITGETFLSQMQTRMETLRT
eukprot:IDg10540t1